MNLASLRLDIFFANQANLRVNSLPIASEFNTVSVENSKCKVIYYPEFRLTNV